MLISVGPFLVNTVIGAIVSFPAAIPVIKFGAGDLLDYFLIWLGVSIAMHAIPSTGDAKSMWQSVIGRVLRSDRKAPPYFKPPTDYKRVDWHGV